MKPLALVGFADSREGARDVDYPVWTINDAEFYNIPRIERLFDLHRKETLVQEGRWEIFRDEPRSYPVYFLEEYPEIPNSRAYPLDRVLEECFENLYVGDKRVEYMSSSFPYLLALAVLEGNNPIYPYGWEFGSDTEFRYQKEGAMLLTGWAMGRGVKVVWPADNLVFPRTLYGYEDYQYITTDRLAEVRGLMLEKYEELYPEIHNRTVDYEDKTLRLVLMYDGARRYIDKKIEADGTGVISRQTLEIDSWDLSIANSKYLGEFNSNHNLYVVAPDKRSDSAKLRQESFRKFYQSSGAMRLCGQLIRECDRRGGTFLMVDPLVKI